MTGGKQKKLKKTERNEAKKSSKAKKPKKYSIEVKVKKPVLKMQPSKKDEVKLEEENSLSDIEAFVSKKEKEEKRAIVIWEKREKEKKIFMWSLVSVFMLLVVVIWSLNAKAMFKKTIPKSKSDLSIEEWSKMTDDIEIKTAEIESSLQKIREFASSTRLAEIASSTDMSGSSTNLMIDTANTAGTSTVINNSSTTPTLNKEELERLKKEIQKLENK